MSHARTQIRSAIKALITGLNTTGNNVYENKQYTFKSNQLPCLNIVMGSEALRKETITRPRDLYRIAEIRIEIRIQQTSTLDTTLDKIINEVEQALGNQLLSELVKDLYLSEIESTDAEYDDAEQPIGMVTLVYMAHYLTAENDPETTL